MPKPMLVTSAIIHDKDKKNILLVLNKRDPRNTLYGFPGGVACLEKHPNPDEAVGEEVKGDMGCIFKGYFFMHSFRDDEIPIVTLFYVGTITGQPHPVCGNIKDVKYFPIKVVQEMDLAYEHNRILKEYLKIHV